MRTWGRALGSSQWLEVTTQPDGTNDFVYLTTLCQVCQLAPNESPFFANYGIPAQRSVMQQLFPDYYVAQTQAQFAGLFAALTIGRSSDGAGNPIYSINVVTHVGVPMQAQVAA